MLQIAEARHQTSRRDKIVRTAMEAHKPVLRFQETLIIFYLTSLRPTEKNLKELEIEIQQLRACYFPNSGFRRS